MKNIILLLALAGLLGCASTSKTKFQERDDPTGLGYKAEKIDIENSFDINVFLDAEVEKSYADTYAKRAAGETCNKAGFKYFDVTNSLLVSTLDGLKTEKLAVFCYETKSRKGLNVIFVGNVTELNKDLKVEELPAGVDVPLKVGDLVTSIDKQKVASVYELKKIVRLAAQKNKKIVEISFVRGERELNAKISIVASDTNYGPEDLETYRTLTN